MTAGGDRSKPTSRRAATLRAAIVTAIVGSLAFAVAGQWSQLPDVEWRLRPEWVAAALLALVAFEWMHIELWRRMLQALGGRVEPWPARSIWATTLLARYVPTSMLMAVGRVALCEREGVPKRVSLASVVYEVALTFTAAVAISTHLVLTLPEFRDHAARWAVLAVPLAGVALLHPRPFAGLANAVLRRAGREPLPLALPFGGVLRYLALFVVSFVVAGAGVLAMTHALHPVAAGDAPVLVASYSLGFVAGVIGFILPGALGAREAGIAVAVAAAVPAAAAIAVAIVLRLLQIGVELAFAAAMPIAARRAR